MLLVQKETIVLLPKALYGFDQFMRGLDYKRKVKIEKSLGWILGSCTLFVLYGYSWTFVV